MTVQRKAYPGGYRPKSNGDKGKYLDYVARAKVKPAAVGESVVRVQTGGQRQPFDMFNPPNPTNIIELNPGVQIKPKDHKYCINCGDWVHNDKFSPDKRSRDGLHSWCKACRNEQARMIYWHQKNSAVPAKAA